MTHYTTLGVKDTATQQEIKSAYRSLAMKYHPDRNNGDDTKFKDISAAYDILGDTAKRQQYDAELNPQHFNFTSSDFFGFNNGDAFSHIFTGGRPRNKNKTTSVNVSMTLEEVITGKTITITVGPNNKTVIVSIPPGVSTGQSIKYQGVGDSTHANFPAGDVIVTVVVLQHATFSRNGNDLVYQHNISIWDALCGCNLQLDTIRGKTLNITIPSGTQPGTILSCKNEGLPILQANMVGNLLVKIHVTIPTTLTDEQRTLINNIRETFQ